MLDSRGGIRFVNGTRLIYRGTGCSRSIAKGYLSASTLLLAALCCLGCAGSGGNRSLHKSEDPFQQATRDVLEAGKSSGTQVPRELPQIEQELIEQVTFRLSSAEGDQLVTPGIHLEQAPDDDSPIEELERSIDRERVLDVLELPQPESIMPMGVTLSEAIRAVLQNDPVLRAGYQEIRQAYGDYVTATLKDNPELEVVQAMLPYGRRFIPDVAEGGPPQLDIMLNFPIDWFVFGKRSAAMVAAMNGLQAIQAEYADLVRVRVMEGALAYVDVLEAQSLWDLGQQDVANLERVEELTRLAVENDARPQVELQRIQLDRLASQQELRLAERDLVAAKANLRALMGERGVVQMFEVHGSLDAPLPAEEISLEHAIAEAESMRPDIAALRRRVTQARSEVELERREGYPELSTQLIHTRQFQEQSIGFPDVSSWGAGINIELPLHNRNQGNRARASAELTQSQFELQAGLVELHADIASISAQLDAARTNAKAIAEEQLRLAEQVRDSINQAYELGARPLIDVLDAQRNYRETFRNYINSRADYWRALYQFNAALGRQSIP